MATSCLIIGKSGTGKSASIETLDPANTFLINVNGKPLPFKGWKLKYAQKLKDNNGNMFSTDNADNIITKVIPYINNNKQIKIAIIDDFQYIMGNEFINRAKEKGFDKFTEIAQHAWTIINKANKCREDLVWFFLSHSDESEMGEIKCKTIGKMLDEKICLEGMFTIVLNTQVDQDKKYWFNTQNNGKSTSKSPKGMFADYQIPNDLSFVYQSIINYEKGE